MSALDELKKKAHNEQSVMDVEACILVVADPQKYDVSYIDADNAAAELAALREQMRVKDVALTEAIGLIKAWHNMDHRRILTDDELESMWQAYQQSPEMKRIISALKGS